MYRLCTFLTGELENLRNKRKFAISVFVISEFYCIKMKKDCRLSNARRNFNRLKFSKKNTFYNLFFSVVK